MLRWFRREPSQELLQAKEAVRKSEESLQEARQKTPYGLKLRDVFVSMKESNGFAELLEKIYRGEE